MTTKWDFKQESLVQALELCKYCNDWKITPIDFRTIYFACNRDMERTKKFVELLYRLKISISDLLIIADLIEPLSEPVVINIHAHPQSN
jgi:hypothetical protein